MASHHLYLTGSVFASWKKDRMWKLTFQPLTLTWNVIPYQDHMCLLPSLTAVTYCRHLLPSLTAVTYCRHLLPSLTAVTYCRHLLPSLTAVTYCRHLPPSLTAVTYRRHLPPSLTAVTYRRHLPPSLTAVTYRRHLPPSLTAVTYRRHLPPSLTAVTYRRHLPPSLTTDSITRCNTGLRKYGFRRQTGPWHPLRQPYPYYRITSINLPTDNGLTQKEIGRNLEYPWQEVPQPNLEVEQKLYHSKGNS